MFRNNFFYATNGVKYVGDIYTCFLDVNLVEGGDDSVDKGKILNVGLRSVLLVAFSFLWDPAPK